MTFLFFFFFFITGTIVGSFLNCVIFRLEKEESFVRGRSHCQNCRHNLNFFDLVPIFSYLFLLGKCRYCHKKISIQYPIIEILTGVVFLAVFSQFYLLTGNDILLFSLFDFINLILVLAIFSLLIIVFVFDFKHFLIPDNIVYILIGLAVIYQIANVNFIPEMGLKELFNPLASGLIPAGIFLAMILASKGRWMGEGDVKLALFMGLFLGSPNILIALFFAFTIGAIIGIGTILLGKKTLKSEIPFGPFLIIGTTIAYFFGNQIVFWYLNILI